MELVIGFWLLYYVIKAIAFLVGALVRACGGGDWEDRCLVKEQKQIQTSMQQKIQSANAIRQHAIDEEDFDVDDEVSTWEKKQKEKQEAEETVNNLFDFGEEEPKEDTFEDFLNRVHLDNPEVDTDETIALFAGDQYGTDSPTNLTHVKYEYYLASYNKKKDAIDANKETMSSESLGMFIAVNTKESITMLVNVVFDAMEDDDDEYDKEHAREYLIEEIRLRCTELWYELDYELTHKED